MPRPLKAKTLFNIAVTREGSTYALETQDEAGKRSLVALTATQALQLADQLDYLLAAEEEELGLWRPQPSPVIPDDSLAVVKWYNATKGFGFVTPQSGGEEVFLHRSVLEQAGLSHLQEDTRVRIQITASSKGPQVGKIELA